ncbi:MAG: AAA family ATPase, partial [Chloroflexota bacterium]
MPISEPLRQIIGRLLAKEPDERYASALDCLEVIQACIGEAAITETSAIRESHLQAATFVGREQEVAELLEALEKAKQGHIGLCLVGGESGVGKSRLLQEVRARALVDDWKVIIGQGVAEGGKPYQLWVDILPHLLLNVELTDLEAGVLQPIVPDIDRILQRPIPTPPDMRGDAGRDRLVMTIIAVLQRQPRPTLLLLEDLQWVEESLLPLKQLLRIREQFSALCIFGTYRDDERPSLLHELPGGTHLSLERLSETAVTRLSHAMLGEKASPPELIALLTTETEGNTFFIVEVMRTLAEEAGRLEHIGQMPLPTTIFTAGMGQ